MKKKLFQFVLGIASLFLYVNNAAAHCEIPCGIYDDEMRINMVLEHIATIEK
jgi:nickel superoxide dismutase